MLKNLASRLLDLAPYHDWAITAAFYAAVHYVEWNLSYQGKHTETSIEKDVDGRWKCRPHVWRTRLLERLAREKPIAQRAYRAYRKLKESSEWARYLSQARAPTEVKWTDGKSAAEFFTVDDARAMVETTLVSVKRGLGVP